MRTARSPGELLEHNHWSVLRAYAAKGALELRDDGRLLIAFTRVPLADMNGVLHTAASAETASQAIEHATAVLSGFDLPWSWSVGPSSRPLEIARALEEAGFGLSQRLIGMEATLRDVPEGAGMLTVEPVVDAESLTEFLSVYNDAYGLQAAEAHAFGELLAADDPASNPVMRHYVGRLDGVAVTCGSLACTPGAAGLYGIGTRMRWRGRGCGSEMTLALMREAARRGHRTALLWATEAASPLYRRLGFHERSAMRTYVPPA